MRRTARSDGRTVRGYVHSVKLTVWVQLTVWSGSPVPKGAAHMMGPVPRRTSREGAPGQVSGRCARSLHRGAPVRGLGRPRACSARSTRLVNARGRWGSGRGPARRRGGRGRAAVAPLAVPRHFAPPPHRHPAPQRRRGGSGGRCRGEGSARKLRGRAAARARRVHERARPPLAGRGGGTRAGSGDGRRA